jgi:hypothetical protein
MMAELEMNGWREATLINRIIVWDRWIEAGVAPSGTKEARDAATQILITRAERLREALQWYVDNDETNEGDEPLPEFGGRSWDEINAYYIDGLNRARAVLAEGPT